MGNAVNVLVVAQGGLQLPVQLRLACRVTQSPIAHCVGNLHKERVRLIWTGSRITPRAVDCRVIRVQIPFVISSIMSAKNAVVVVKGRGPLPVQVRLRWRLQGRLFVHRSWRHPTIGSGRFIRHPHKAVLSIPGALATIHLVDSCHGITKRLVVSMHSLTGQVAVDLENLSLRKWFRAIPPRST